MLTEADNTTAFSLLALAELSTNWAFYRYPSNGSRPMPGRFFAIDALEQPASQNDGTYQFSAVTPILHQPNSPVHLDTINSTAIDQAVAVKGENPAAVVAKSHPQLIRYLLAL